MTLIWTSTEYTLSEKAVYETLSESPADTRREIAARLGITERTATDAVNKLKDAGLVNDDKKIKITKQKVI